MAAVELAIEELAQKEELWPELRDDSKLWTIDQLARRWQLSERVVNRWIREGWIEICLFPGKPDRSNWRVSEKQRRAFEAACEERGADWVEKEIRDDNDEVDKP